MNDDYHVIETIERYNSQVKSGAIAIESPPCLCHSKDSMPVYKKDHFGLWSPVQLCQNCGLIYLSPRMTGTSYASFYSSDDYRLIYDEHGVTEEDHSWRYTETNHIFS